mmetsp:Transcript_17188/g.25559  ORF Transcript_17188/g.25559 Transcript_17188/m.25559 type:complete len:419 (-) Transcript_17188:261-1517(-)|eukprot:15365810-Ditylum_brightwellii.AAC.1
MCPGPDGIEHVKENPNSNLKAAVAVLGVCTIGLLAATIALAVNNNNDEAKSTGSMTQPESVVDLFESKKASVILSDTEANTCYKKKLELPNKDCIHVPGPQAGANVTKGYVGGKDVGNLTANLKQYWQTAMCPVNVHWHLGTEHYSTGEYDENGNGPHGTAERPEWANRKLAEENVRGGFRCHHFDAADEKFTKEYDWQHCIGMEVGETYEVHWPHSAAGACGTVNQYQTPFYDGVFCNLNAEIFGTLKAQDIASAVGVQGQIFTIVNDESYFYPDLMRGMIVDKDMGKDLAYYTGSTTGTTRNNDICSQYTPITWQVDRKCHMISASSFDKLCYDMKMQRDDMEDDLHAHGSRELVKDEYVANNQANRRHLWADGEGNLHPDDHYTSGNLRDHNHAHIHSHDHEHDHDHHHHHHEWY